MATFIASDTVRQGSFGFSLGLSFVFPGYVGTVYHDAAIPDTWEVRFVNPEGVVTVKTTGITFVDPALPRAYFTVVTGDLDKAGVYSYQVIKTTAGARVKSEVDTFTVEESVPSLVGY